MADPPDPLPSLASNPTPDIFSVSRRFDMATILVAMCGYALLFGGLRILTPWPEVRLEVIGGAGILFAVVAIGQAVAIRWNNPRAASVIAGMLFWLAAATYYLPHEGACEFVAGLFIALTLGPISGYLVGTLVGGVFLISHYLRETQAFRRRVSAAEHESESPGSTQY